MAKDPEVEPAKDTRLDKLEKQVGRLTAVLEKVIDKITEEKPAAPAAKEPEPETPEQKKVAKAVPAFNPVNPEWQNKAEEILGKKLERCETFYLRGGGVIFTLVIKKEFSNAKQEYFLMNKEDRRSKEVSAEGIEGVENWCKLVAANLNRPH